MASPRADAIFAYHLLMKRYLWVFLWAIVVLVLCLMPTEHTGVDRVKLFEGVDKLVHTGFFFVFSVLLYDASIRVRGTVRPSFRVLIRVVLISTLFALLTEFLQWKIFTYRSAEIWDLAANMIGIGMGTFAYLLLHHGRSVDH